MAVDLKEIEKAGGTQEKLKKLFETPHPDRSEKLKALIDLHSQRMQNGINQNLRDARHWYAIDLAYDAPQRQVTWTLLREFVDRNPDLHEIHSKAQEWGLTSMLTPLLDKEGKQVMMGNVPAMKLDLPTFTTVLVPLCMAYLKMRWAKIFNDRDRTPLYKYEPLRASESNRLKAQIITSVVDRMTVEMGMRAVERQSIFQMLLYGICLGFPTESYYREKQMVGGKETVVKEGVRFTTPHPSRIGYDLTHPTYTFNSDTGADCAWFWELQRYGDIAMNKDLWNVENITWGKGSGQWPWSDNFRLFTSFYPCTMKFPDLSGWQAKSELDRETNAFRWTAADYDSAVNVVVLFHKVVPKDWGLYDYKYPVWHRFVYGGDGTVLYCEPLAYSPIVAHLYDYDSNRSRNASLGLEVIPWQDELGNLLSQYLLSVRKNLTRVVFWNTDILSSDEVREVKNSGEKLYQELRFIPFSGKKMGWTQESVANAFYPVSFPTVNTQEIMQSISTMLTMMERALGFSSQELAAAASHEQSAREITVIGTATSNKLRFTDGFVDEAWWARKRLLYDAFMAYADDQVVAEVADLNDADREMLKELGFEIEEDGKTHVGVKGAKDKISITSFSSARDGIDRLEDAKIAASMIQVFQSILSNPAIVQAAGLEQIFQLFNQVLPYTGFPKEFKLRYDKKMGQEQNAGIAQDQLKQFAQQTMQAAQKAGAESAQQVVQEQMKELGSAVSEKLIKPMAEKQAATEQAAAQAIQQLQATDQALAQKGMQVEQAVGTLAQKFQQLEQAVMMIVGQATGGPPTGPPGPPPGPPGPPPGPQQVPIDPATGLPVGVPPEAVGMPS